MKIIMYILLSCLFIVYASIYDNLKDEISKEFYMTIFFIALLITILL